MEVSKIRNVFDLYWIQLAVEVKMFALVPRGQTDTTEAHGFIAEMGNGWWKVAAMDTDGGMMELPIASRRIDARQAVQKQIIRVNSQLAKAKVDDFQCPNGCDAETEATSDGTICGICGSSVTATVKEVKECLTN